MGGFFAGVEAWLTSMGGWAYLAAPLVMAVVAVFPVPAEAPAMLNGMLFGPVWGSVVTWVGAFAGAWISFELANRGGRSIAERMVSPERLRQVDRLAEDAGSGGLLLARFVPLIAFTALNWGAGLCKVPRGRFLWTTAVGIAPGAVLFTSTGVGLKALWARSPGLAMAFMVSTATALVAWTVWRRRTREAREV